MWQQFVVFMLLAAHHRILRGSWEVLLLQAQQISSDMCTPDRYLPLNFSSGGLIMQPAKCRTMTIPLRVHPQMRVTMAPKRTMDLGQKLLQPPVILPRACQMPGSTQATGSADATQAPSYEDQRVRSLLWATLSDAFCRLRKGAWCDGMDKCFLGFIHDVHLVGSPGFTPGLLCSMLLLDCLDRIFLALARVPVWVRACLGQCGIGSPTAGRRQRAILTAFIVLYQCGLCTATAEHLRAPDRASGTQGVQCLSIAGHTAHRAIATPCRSRNPVLPVHLHPRDSPQEKPLVLGRDYAGRARAGSPSAGVFQQGCPSVGLENRERLVDTDLADCVDGPTLLELVPTGDKLWAWFNAATLVETLEEHFDGVPPSGCRGAFTEVRQQVLLVEAIPLSAFQCQALSLNDLLPGSSDHYQRPEELWTG